MLSSPSTSRPGCFWQTISTWYAPDTSTDAKAPTSRFSVLTLPEPAMWFPPHFNIFPHPVIANRSASKQTVLFILTSPCKKVSLGGFQLFLPYDTSENDEMGGKVHKGISHDDTNT